jgi:hypothetical protein
MAVTENTNLLSQRSPQSYTDQQDQVSVISTSAQDDDVDDDSDRLLKSRLNGSPLFLVLCG